MEKAKREGLLMGMSKGDIQKKRNTIKPVDNKSVNIPPDSDDEDAKQDLLFRRRLFLKRPDR